MTSIDPEFAYFLRGRAQQNLKALLAYFAFLATMILVYAVIFRFLMWHIEGREFSLIAGIYWTITVMTTLGFGDITFHTDLGYIFAAIVTLSGVVFLLILLPFGLISLFLAPWIEHRLRYRPVEELPPETCDHVLIFGFDPIARSFTRKLQARNIPFTVITPDYALALRLEEREGLRVVAGNPCDKEILHKVKVAKARYVIANLSDPENASLCLAIRSLCSTPIAAFASEARHADLLRQAGANQVIPLFRILGRFLATRATTCGARAHVLDSFGKLKIAEVPVYGTPFVGLTLEEAQIRQRIGLSVIGIVEKGHLITATRATRLDEHALLLLAGTREQLTAFEKLIGEKTGDDLVFILGHGRIGCAAASFLERKPVPFILVDPRENPLCEEHIAIASDATTPHALRKAGIDQAKGLIITTNDDSTNIFLTLASRRHNPHMRIVARANSDENISQFYTAGADFVVSNASVGANILMNILESKDSVFLTEGINVFRRPLPASLAGKTITESQIRPVTGCSIVALESPAGEQVVVPSPEKVLVAGTGLILIGSPEQEELFAVLFEKG
ncbi:MAG: NAD-binding protein [Desulfuromonadales bacterium]|nr:NAD-binding protein [Desulfuromonadales bacterium]